MSDKIYLGIGKEFGKYGDINVSICLSDLTKEMLQNSKNGKQYLNIVVSKRKEKGKYGETHSVKLNDWKPENSQSSQDNVQDKNKEYNDLPF